MAHICMKVNEIAKEVRGMYHRVTEAATRNSQCGWVQNIPLRMRLGNGRCESPDRWWRSSKVRRPFWLVNEPLGSIEWDQGMFWQLTQLTNHSTNLLRSKWDRVAAAFLSHIFKAKDGQWRTQKQQPRANRAANPKTNQTNMSGYWQKASHKEHQPSDQWGHRCSFPRDLGWNSRRAWCLWLWKDSDLSGSGWRGRGNPGNGMFWTAQTPPIARICLCASIYREHISRH